MRGLSQNVTFIGTDALGDANEPPGLALAERLAAQLEQTGIAVSEPDNWRDAGWSFKATVANVEEAIIVASTPSGGWFVQIAPTNSPSLLQHVFGPKEHPAMMTTHDLACRVQQALVSDGRFTGFRWRWDGPPEEGDTTEPLPRRKR
jgi:hypothetical protein